jgi:Mg2+/Co2+ transporter CorB
MLLLSAFFSGAETALMTLNRYRLRHLVKLKQRSAINTLQLLNKQDLLNSFILLGNNFVNILAAALTTFIATHFYQQKEESLAIAILLLTLGVLIFSEIIPKKLASLRPELLAFPASWIILPLLKVFFPVIWLVNGVAYFFLRLFGFNPKKKSQDTFNKEELKNIVTEPGSLIPVRYQKMLLGILDLESATVEDIMTPRHEIVGIDLDASLPDVLVQIKRSPHTRLPVYKKSIDNVEGFLHIRSVLTLLEHKDFSKDTILNLLTKPSFIPDSTPVHNQIHRFKTEKIRIGLVVDEYGDVLGLVTLDDLLQEIVGELITDDDTVRRQNDGSYLVDANITVRELNRLTQWALPTEGPKTLNGLIVEFMETIPESGTSIKLHGYPLEILKRDGSAVKLVKFLPENVSSL